MTDPQAGGSKPKVGCLSLAVCAVIGSVASALALWLGWTGGYVLAGPFLIAAAIAFGAIAVAERR